MKNAKMEALGIVYDLRFFFIGIYCQASIILQEKISTCDQNEPWTTKTVHVYF